jgi:chorismate-pyruvate lyase
MVLLMLLAEPAHAAHPWPDTHDARREALALLQRLNAALLAGTTATVVLERWCHDHNLTGLAKIVAKPVAGIVKAPCDEMRARLKIGYDTPVSYRHVTLMCGDVILSQAENWYVPERLTASMVATLSASDIPFGKVVLPLNPSRETISATMLWSPSPLPRRRAKTSQIPEQLLEHRAIVFDGQHVPIAAVVETYQRGVLAFGR